MNGADLAAMHVSSLYIHGRPRGAGGRYTNFLNIKVPFVPPNPKELDIT
jgi:hypothetical protein